MMANQEQMNNFVGLSAVLTGFNQSIIAPSIDPINVKQEYFDKFTSEIPNSDKILNEYASLKTAGKSDQEIGETILANSDFETPCRQLIFLWYSGAWGSVQDGMVISDLLSAKSYTQGLAWQVMQSHPMGDSNYRYGYWAEEPAPLDKYTGNTND
jgi:hypothetical protein